MAPFSSLPGTGLVFDLRELRPRGLNCVSNFSGINHKFLGPKNALNGALFYTNNGEMQKRELVLQRRQTLSCHFGVYSRADFGGLESLLNLGPRMGFIMVSRPLTKAPPDSCS